MKIQKNISLAKYTSFKTGGPAKFFCKIRKKSELKALLRKYKKYYILGAGTNILASDAGYNGLIIKLQNTKYKIQNTKITADAGVSLARLVSEAVKYNLTGLEWAIGIPGTIGGAISVNASAFRSCIKDSVEKIEKINNIIWSVTLKLKSSFNKKLMQENLAYRLKTQPQGYACAGCVFKNPKNKSAGQLIDQAGLKGKKIGKAQISKKHANFILNLGNAKASDVLKLANFAKNKVKQEFGINLEFEIKLVGF